MNTLLYKFFHNETNDRTEKGLVNIPKDKNVWPEAWKKIVYKKYSLFKPIALPQAGGFLFEKILNKRRSSQGYILGNEVTLSDLAYILKCGYGLQEGNEEERRGVNRTSPSGGKLYPLEVYVFLFKQIGDCASGIYHYGIQGHVLEPIVLAHSSREDILSFAPQQEWLQDTNGMICMTGVFDRMIGKYGSRGYRYILLEAGHVAQNMLLAGTERGVNIIPVGGVEADKIEGKIGLSNGEEGLIYALYL